MNGDAPYPVRTPVPRAHPPGRRRLVAAALAVAAALGGCAVDDDVPDEATAGLLPAAALPTGVPPAPARPALAATLPMHPEPPWPANAAADAPPPVPRDLTDADIDDIVDAQRRESEGPSPAGPVVAPEVADRPSPATLPSRQPGVGEGNF